MNAHLVKQTSQKPIDFINSDKCENAHETSLCVDDNPLCPCCGSPLLRHVSLYGVYWYCSHCHQKMPPAHN